MKLLLRHQFSRATRHYRQYLYSTDKKSLLLLIEYLKRNVQAQPLMLTPASVKITVSVVGAPKAPTRLILTNLYSGSVQESEVDFAWPTIRTILPAIAAYCRSNNQAEPSFLSRKNVVVWLIRNPLVFLKLRRMCCKSSFFLDITAASHGPHQLVTQGGDDVFIAEKVPLFQRLWLTNAVFSESRRDVANTLEEINISYFLLDGRQVDNSVQRLLVHFLEPITAFGILPRAALGKICRESLWWPAKESIMTLFDFQPPLHGWPRVLSQHVPALAPSASSTLEPVISAKQFEPARVVDIGPAEIWHGLIMVRDGKLIQIDRGADPRIAFSAGLESIVKGSCLNHGLCVTYPPAAPTQFLEEAIVALGRADTNWFHWLTETLPGVLACDEVLDEAIPLVVRDVIPRQALESLKLLLGRPIIQATSKDTISVKKIFTHVHCSAVLDHHWSEQPRFRFNRELLLATQKRILSTALKSSGTANQKVYSFRNSRYRRLRNSGSLARLAEGCGFTREVPENQSFLQQVNRFNQVKTLLAQGGGSVVNAMFMGPGSSVIVVCGGIGQQDFLWKAYLDIFGLQSQFIIGDSTRRGRLSGPHSDFSVNPSQFRAALLGYDS